MIESENTFAGLHEVHQRSLPVEETNKAMKKLRRTIHVEQSMYLHSLEMCCAKQGTKSQIIFLLERKPCNFKCFRSFCAWNWNMKMFKSAAMYNRF